MKGRFVNTLWEIPNINQSTQPRVVVNPVCSRNLIFQLIVWPDITAYAITYIPTYIMTWYSSFSLCCVLIFQLILWHVIPTLVVTWYSNFSLRCVLIFQLMLWHDIPPLVVTWNSSFCHEKISSSSFLGYSHNKRNYPQISSIKC